jgi:hypothetical protein
MKMKKIATAALVPAAIAGVAISGWAAVDAGTGNPASPSQAQQIRQAERHAARLDANHSASKRVGSARTTHADRLRADHGGHDRSGQQTLAQPGQSSDAKAHRAAAARAAAARAAAARAAARGHSAAAPTTQPAAPSTASLFASMSSFERCVAWRESGDNPTASSAGLFGILPATWASLGYSGTAGQASVAEQMAAFSRLYAQDGTQPWAPYDGC